MGQTSSQLPQSQAATQDVPLTSQPLTQLPALDGPQEADEPKTARRVAYAMDASVEDTVKKAREERAARRVKKKKTSPRRKTMPQHMRGFAIQPSQELLATQEDELQADAGVEEPDIQPVGQHDGADDTVLDSQPAQSVPAPGGKTVKGEGKKKRLHIRDDDNEPTVDAHEPAPEDVNVNTPTDQPADSKPKKRKQIDIELERLRADAEGFTPELESTPRAKPANKRQKRAQSVEQPEPIVEEAVDDAEIEEAVARVKPQRRGKAKASRQLSGGDAEHPNIPASAPKPKGGKFPKAKPRAKGTEPVAAPAAEETTKSRPSPHSAEEAREDDLPVADEQNVDADLDESPAVDNAAGDRPVGTIPTPPESPDEHEGAEEADEVVQATAAGNNNGGAIVDDVEAEAVKPAKKPRKRKRALDEAPKVDVNDDGPSLAVNEGTAPARDRETAKPGKLTKRMKASTDGNEVAQKGRGQVKGTWSKEERAKADEIFADVARVTAIPEYELKATIIDWKNSTPALNKLKEELCEAFPGRDFRSIRRFCQRRYNAFERGKWTAEQDQRLREGYELWPDQWTAIGDHVDRYWEDCRGRWRDVLSKNEKKAESGPWSKSEELKLAKVVQECRDIIMKDTEDEEVLHDHSKADALISWKVVADKMDNTRAAKRCREKWKAIKDQDFSAANVPATTQPITSKKLSSRLQEADAEFDRCEAGDILDMLNEICAAVPDPSTVFDHETTFWSVVAVKNSESKFTSSLRRRALQSAIEQYPCKAVRTAETLAATAKGVREWIMVLHEKDMIELNRTYEAEPKAKAKKKVTKSVAKKPDADVAPKEKTANAKAEAAKKHQAIADAAPVTTTAEKAPRASLSAHEQATEIYRSRRKRAAKAKAVERAKPDVVYKSADRIVDSDDDGEEGLADDADGADGAQLEQTEEQGESASGDALDDGEADADEADADEADADDDDDDDDDSEARKETITKWVFSGEGEYADFAAAEKEKQQRQRERTDERSLGSAAEGFQLDPGSFVERCRGSGVGGGVKRGGRGKGRKR